MEQDLDKVTANSSVVIKEETDNKDGSVSDGRSEAQFEMASDGLESLVPDKQEYNLEEGDTSDSSTESDTTQGLVLIIIYKRKIKAMWKKLTRLLEIPLNLNQALKWKYVCSKPVLVQQRILKLKTIAEDATFVGSHVNIFLGKQTIEPDLTTLSKQIGKILLEKTDSLVISWLPVSTSFKEEIYGELCQVLATSNISRQHEMHIDKADSGLIRLVFNEKQELIISDLLTETMKNLKEKLRSEYISSSIVMPGVQWQVFQYFGVSQSVYKMFPLIELACDVVESNDEFVFNLFGPLLQVQNAEEWIKDNYLTPYEFEKVPFEHLNKLDEFIDVSRVLEKTLASQSFTDLFWTVNKFTRSVTYSSKDTLVLRKALSDSSKCLETCSRSVSAGVMSVEETEDMINDITHFDGMSHNYQCMRMMTKNNILNIKVIGTELDPILKEIDKRFVKHDELEETKGSVQPDSPIYTTGGRRENDFKEAGDVQKSFEDDAMNKVERKEPYLTVNDQQPLVKPRERYEQSYHPEFDLKRQAKDLHEYTTYENIKVYVYEANILKLPVDCIVNAANNTLQHRDGVARVIAQAAGRRLDQEVFDYIRRHGIVPVGKTCVTTAGKLHYDCVIHAVGPRWSDYTPHSFQDVRNCEKDLYSAVMGSFFVAEERGLKSIALPSISATIFAVPEEVCVYHYAKATIDYSRKQSPNALEEIHFIDINASIVQKIQEMFTTILKDHNDPHYSTEKYVNRQKADNSRNFQSPDSNRNTSPVRGPVTNTELPDRKPVRNIETNVKFNPIYHEDREIHVLETEHCKLTILCGDIMRIHAVAIVAMQDVHGSGMGKIARLISYEISFYQRLHYLCERNAVSNSNTKPGDVYYTKGYDSGYEIVLHAVVPDDIRCWSLGLREDVIKKTLKKILKTLSDKNMNSVVMCLIGAGNESTDDVQIAASVFIQVYKEYCEKQRRNSSMPLQLTLVCRTKDMLDTVMKTFQHFGLLDSSTEKRTAFT